MRITDTMTSNKMLLNINRSMTTVDKLYTMMTTGKKIQMPSDDPIIASRALKFRANISDTAQYKRNTAQGLSWMESTEQGFSNLITAISNIRDLCVQGSSDQFEISDRAAIIAEIQALYEQLGSELNITYAGRYVFSGQRTDFPPIITQNDPGAHFLIKQDFSLEDIEKTKNYVKMSTSDAPVSEDINRLKLPYNGVDQLTEIAVYDAGGVKKTYPVYYIDMANDTQGAAYGKESAYTPQPGEIHFIPTTGELIIPDDILLEMQTSAVGGISVEYEVKGLNKGDLNPVVYFECRDLASSSKTATKLNLPALAGGSFGVTADIGTDKPIKLVINKSDGTREEIYATVIKNAAAELPPKPDEIKYDAVSGTFYFGTNVEAKATDPANITTQMVFYEKGLDYNMDNQKLQFEFGVNTRIDINNLGKDVYTAQLYADLKSLIDMVNSVSPSTEASLIAKYEKEYTGEELAKYVKDQMNAENQNYRSTLQKNFSNMLSILDKHQANISKEYTDLGSRMNRLSFIETRLSEDEVNFNKLMSDNENIDYLEVIMKLKSAESVYSAALQTGGNVIRISLADFIR